MTRRKPGYRTLIEAEGLEPLPGAASWVRRLNAAGWRQAVASSAPRQNIGIMLRAIGLDDLLDVFVGAEDVSNGKPDPEIFLTAASRLAVAPSRCIVVEDAAVGIEAAKRAGMAAIGIGLGPGVAADVVVPTLADLPDDAFEKFRMLEASTGTRIMCFAFVRRLVAACLAASLAAASPAFAQGAAQTAPAARGLAGLADLSRSLEQLVEKISPSVVQIFVTGYVPPDEEDKAATGEPSLERSSGSGVILDPDGYIITNAHVVEYATRLEVELPFAATGGAPGRSIVRRRGRNVGAQVVAIDHETDLAVVKVEAKGLPALTIGDSDTLRPGQLVLAFGSPWGSIPQ